MMEKWTYIVECPRCDGILFRLEDAPEYEMCGSCLTIFPSGEIHAVDGRFEDNSIRLVMEEGPDAG